MTGQAFNRIRTGLHFLQFIYVINSEPILKVPIQIVVTTIFPDDCSSKVLKSQENDFRVVCSLRAQAYERIKMALRFLIFNMLLICYLFKQFGVTTVFPDDDNASNVLKTQANDFLFVVRFRGRYLTKLTSV